MSGSFMKKNGSKKSDELRPEYDFKNMPGGVRGKYIRQFREGHNLALLDADTAKAFPDDRAVNDALRIVMTIARRRTSTASRRRSTRTVRAR